MQRKRNPHHVKSAMADALHRQGIEVAPESVGGLLARICGFGDWNGLLDGWWSPARSPDDLCLSEGYLAARRSRQLEILRGAGAGYASALSVLYETHPTSERAPEDIEPQEIEREGFLVRDGMFVRILARDGRWSVRHGLGHVGYDDALVVDSAAGDTGSFESVREAAEAASGILKGRVAELRERFLEKRSFFRFRSGHLFETITGSMDAAEVISPDIVRAFMSGSSERGCYVLAGEAADQLPVYAVYERHSDGRGFLDAEGMGLVVPLVFPDVFTKEERQQAEDALAADHPLTYAVLAGGMVDRSNLSAVMMEWDDEHEPEDFPEYMILRRMSISSSGRSVVVLGVLTDDVLNGREIADGYLFSMPAEDYEKALPIDPTRHRMLQSDHMAIKLVRPR